jgi:hypothetical protein
LLNSLAALAERAEEHSSLDHLGYAEGEKSQYVADGPSASINTTALRDNNKCRIEITGRGSIYRISG